MVGSFINCTFQATIVPVGRSSSFETGISLTGCSPPLEGAPHLMQEHARVMRLSNARRGTEALGKVADVVTGKKQQRYPTVDKLLGKWIDHFAVEIDVEDGEVDGFLASCRAGGGERRMRAGNRAAGGSQILLEQHRHQNFVLGDKHAQTIETRCRNPARVPSWAGLGGGDSALWRRWGVAISRWSRLGVEGQRPSGQEAQTAAQPREDWATRVAPPKQWLCLC